MNIKILMSTMNKKDIEELKLNEKNISNCIIINQTKEQIKNIEKGDVVFYSYNEKGLAKSRNRLLEKIESDVDIGIITDDDVTFVKEYKDIVQKAYDTIKNADIEELKQHLNVNCNKPEFIKFRNEVVKAACSEKIEENIHLTTRN